MPISRIKTDGIQDDAITSAKIGDTNIGTADIADSSVTTAKIADANVTLAKLSATGTKDATTYLRGDNTFSALSTTLAGLDDATVNASDPTYNENIAGASVGHLWINSTSGEVFVLTDATTNANVWTNIGDGSGQISAPYTLDYLMVAGGASAGALGGSGGGGMVESNLTVNVGTTYTITVGAGGSGTGGGGDGGQNGTNSTAGTDYTGGGGGGQGLTSSGTSQGTRQDGGDGVTILKIPSAKYSGTYTGSSVESFVQGSDRILIFKSSGTYTA
jgi:hypothetical protein